MAKLRIRQDQYGVGAQRTPRATAANFGQAAGEALSQLGSAVVGFGAQQARKEEADADWQTRIELAKLASEQSQKIQELSDAMPDDAKGLADGWGSSYDSAVSLKAKAMPADQAELFQNRAQLLRIDLGDKAIAEEARKRGEFARRQHMELMTGLERGIANAPLNDQEFGIYFKVAMDALPDEQQIRNPEDRARLRDATAQTLSRARLSSSLDRGVEGATKALADLKAGFYDDKLTPEQITAERARAENAVQSYEAQYQARLAHDLQVEARVREATGIASEASQAKLKAISDPEKRRELEAQLSSSLAIGRATVEYMTADPEKISAEAMRLQEAVSNPKASESARQAAVREMDAFRQVMSQRQALLVNDRGQLAANTPAVQRASGPLASVLQSFDQIDPTTAKQVADSYKAASYGEQQRIGIPEGQERLPNAVIDQMAGMLSANLGEGGNAETAYQTMEKMRLVFGQDVMTQIYGSKPELRRINVIHAMDTQPGREAMFALSKQPENEGLLKDKISGLNTELQSYIKDFAATTRGKSDTTALAVLDVARAVALQKMRSGMAMSTAAEQAMGQVVNDRYIYVPRSMFGDIEARAPKVFTTPEGRTMQLTLPRQRAMLWAVSQRIGTMEEVIPVGNTEAERDAWRKAINDGNARAQTSDDEMGYNFTDSFGNLIMTENGPLFLRYDHAETLSDDVVRPGGGNFINDAIRRWRQEAKGEAR